MRFLFDLILDYYCTMILLYISKVDQFCCPLVEHLNWPLTMADCVVSIIHDLAEHNARLRDIVNKDIAYIWFETTKAECKEMFLNELKTNKSFFIETLKALKEYDFEHYDLEKDSEGLYK